MTLRSKIIIGYKLRSKIIIGYKKTIQNLNAMKFKMKAEI